MCGDAGDRLESQMLSSGPKILYAGVRALVPSAPACVQRFSDKDGMPTQSAQEENSVIQNHLAATLSGGVASMETIICADKARLVASGPSLRCMPRESGAVPSLVATTRALSRAKCKAVGEDRIGGDISRAAPAALGRVRHQLLAKAAVPGSLPSLTLATT